VIGCALGIFAEYHRAPPGPPPRVLLVRLAQLEQLLQYSRLLCVQNNNALATIRERSKPLTQRHFRDKVATNVSAA
jgi:hypothetical protein